MKRQKMLRFALVAAVAGALIGFQNCSKVGDAQQPGSNGSSFDSQSGGTTTDNPKATLNVVITDSSGTATGQAQLCLGQISLSGDQEPIANPAAQLAGNITSYAQMMDAMMQFTQELSTNFTLLGVNNFVKTIPVAPGNYSNVDLTLDQNCAYGSLSVPTANGNLQISAPLTLHFVGNINTAQNGELVLDIKDILQALAGAQSAADVESILAGVSGTF